MAAPRWNEGDDAKLKSLVTEGVMSFGEIADVLGKTRNSCIGRAHRLGLSGGMKPKDNPQRAERADKPSAVVMLFPKAKRPAPRYAQPEASTTAFGIPKSILGLKDHHCRYPVHMSQRTGMQLFCAADKQAGSSYCREHHLIVWVPTRRQASELERMARVFK